MTTVLTEGATDQSTNQPTDHASPAPALFPLYPHTVPHSGVGSGTLSVGGYFQAYPDPEEELVPR